VRRLSLNEKRKTIRNVSDLQSLEQERHLLRRRLEEAVDESDARASELQADVEALKSQLEEQNERARRTERDQAALVAELTAQNTRLADQLREAAKQEEQLLLEVKVLREKCALRNTTLQDHVSSLEILRDEVSSLSLSLSLSLSFSLGSRCLIGRLIPLSA
jgi:predicted nuclease with TOPRIM domain